MSVSIKSGTLPSWAQATNESNDLVRLESWLPTLLSTIAGMVDVIGFLTLGLFTAHVTGNLVVIAALLVRGGPPNIAQVLSVPVFVLAGAAVWLIAKTLERSAPALPRPLLLIQFLLLVCVLVFSVIYNPAANPHGLMAVVVAMFDVLAMGCQFAFLHLGLPSSPSTAAMTGNLTNLALSLLDTLFPNQPLTQGANERLKKTSRVIVGFFVGCLAGAAAVSFLGDWAWLAPVALAGAALALR